MSKRVGGWIVNAACLTIAGGIGSTALGQGNTGPDVIVGDLYDIAHYGSSGGIHAFAVGTISCNVGTQHLKWIRDTNEHPVIAQNMYRFKDGRFEQIGLSWLKHGFTALAGNVCSTCPPGSPSGTLLGVGCSDPYSASLNGGQTSAGPRWQVNAATGYFPYGPANPSWNGNIARRLQVKDEDIRPALNAGAVYFVEGQYVTRDDALAGNAANNAAYRRINLTYNSATSVTPSLTSTTRRTQPAIYAWREMDPTVQIATVEIPSDGVYTDTTVNPAVHRQAKGTMFVACRITDNGDGTWNYDYAIENISSDRSAGALRFAIAPNVVVTDVSFRSPVYHSGDGIPMDMGSPNTTARNFSNGDWAVTNAAGTLRWATDRYEVNVNANAIRWGTMYNFRFTANALPTMGSGTIELFKPAPANAEATPSEVQFNLPVPGPFVPRNIRVRVDAAAIPELVPPGTPLVVDADISPGDDQVQPNSAVLFYRHTTMTGAPFTQIPMASMGGTSYRATIPGTGCGNTMTFYVRATGANSGAVTWPIQGADQPFSRPIGVVSTAFEDDFETDKGWVGVDPTDTATATGRWVRADPIPTTYNPGTGPVFIQPGDDHTPGAGVLCWFTGQGVGGGPAGAADVDGGKTTLTSPTIDLSRSLTTRLQYWRWYFSGTGTGRNDPFTVQISNDNGQTWTNVEVVAASAGNGGWEFADYPVSLPLTAQMKVRFIAQDLGADDTVEAAVDDLKFVSTGCVQTPTCAADWNRDGSVGVQDLLSFLVGYFDNNADFNNDQTTSLQDVFDYLAAYHTPCP